VQQAAFKGFTAPGPTGSLFPFLFVTIACGACSGFHGLVCSGTTSKQIEKESHCRVVGYGAMLLEAFVAVIALSTVMMASDADLAGKAPGAIYGAGFGHYLAVIIGEKNRVFATTFGAMAFSTFVFDTLDVTTRLGRYILQELFGWKGPSRAFAATLLTVAVPLGFLLAAGEGAYRAFWVLFGTSNQLMAALLLLGISVWLRRSKRKTAFAVWPMAFVMTVTLCSLALQAMAGFRAAWAGGLHLDPGTLNGVVSVLLLGLALVLIREAVRAVRAPVSA
jgi:carbon starvation protein